MGNVDRSSETNMYAKKTDTHVKNPAKYGLKLYMYVKFQIHFFSYRLSTAEKESTMTGVIS